MPAERTGEKQLRPQASPRASGADFGSRGGRGAATGFPAPAPAVLLPRSLLCPVILSGYLFWGLQSRAISRYLPVGLFRPLSFRRLLRLVAAPPAAGAHSHLLPPRVPPATFWPRRALLLLWVVSRSQHLRAGCALAPGARRYRPQAVWGRGLDGHVLVYFCVYLPPVHHLSCMKVICACLSVLSICLPIHPSTHPSVHHLSIIHPSVHPSVCLGTYVCVYVCMYPSNYLSTSLPVYPSVIYVSLHHPSVYVSIHLSPLSLYIYIIYLSIFLSIICPSILCLSTYLSIIYHLSIIKP